MHMSDALVSPQVGAVMWGATAVVAGYCAKKVREEADESTIPLMAVSGAFVFAAQMLNFSIPGTGSSGHLGGGLLLAVLLGPHAAFLVMASILGVQALFFGDGGILALGANAFNCGCMMPFVGYLVFAALKGSSKPFERRFAVAAAIGGYAGINAAAFLVALELGLQPALHHTSSGTPLYCPFPLGVTVPAMMTAHLTVAGAAEAVLTGGIVAFLGKHHPELFARHAREAAHAASRVSPEGGKP